MKKLISLICLFSLTSFGATLKITPKDAAEMVLKQSTKTQEINLKYLQLGVQPMQILSLYDWKLTAESGYEFDKSASFQTSDAKYERFKTTLNLSKNFTTGTIFSADFSRISQKATFASFSALSSSTPANATLDLLGVSVEQALWYDAFGTADSANVKAANLNYEATKILRADELQTLVLDTLRQYWNTYVSQENFKESIAARDRYKTLVETVKRKNSFGYTNPGELSQVQAELENREQNVKTASIQYLQNLESFLLHMNLEPQTTLDFSVSKDVPPAPALDPKSLEDLRQVRSQKMKVTAAQESYSAAKIKDPPVLNLVGKAYTTGEDDSSEKSLTRLASVTNPKYYLGLKFIFTFGSDSQKEEIINKKSALQIEEIKLNRQRQEIKDKETQAMRKVQAYSGVAESSLKLKNFREKAVNELQTSYNQGRTDLRTLIDAMNAYFVAVVQYTKSLGDYQIALNEWAASRDELIPDSQNKE